MHNFTKIFFSRRKAEAFLESLKAQGHTDAVIYLDTDGFGQRIYITAWNID